MSEVSSTAVNDDLVVCFEPEKCGGISLRLAVVDDDAFFLHLYEGVRAPECAVFGWAEEQFRAFCALQFRFREAGYAGYELGLQHMVVERNGAPVGRLSVLRELQCWRLINIELLPAERARGIGSCLIQGLQRHAARQGLGVRLRVGLGNPAQRLYERNGFVVEADDGFMLQMAWSDAVSEGRDQ